MQPSASLRDLAYVIDRLNSEFNYVYTIIEVQGKSVRILESNTSPGIDADVLEFPSVQSAYEFLIEVNAELIRILAAG